MNKELYKISYTLKKQRDHRIVTVLLVILLIFSGISLFRAFVIFPVHEHSESMQPDIPAESNILFTPIIGTPGRGDVVLLAARTADKKPILSRAADSLISFFTAQQYSILNNGSFMGDDPQIRRVVGIPGDTIYMQGYVVFVQSPDEKHFLTEFEKTEDSYDVNIVSVPAGWDSSIGVSGSFGKMRLGRNEYFVLGDNRCSCVDSRLWGPVNIENISAKGIAVYFPFSKLRKL